jgi:DNA-directed RNA polymerase subunit N (RpoN/RPB10)
VGGARVVREVGLQARLGSGGLFSQVVDDLGHKWYCCYCCSIVDGDWIGDACLAF